MSSWLDLKGNTRICDKIPNIIASQGLFMAFSFINSVSQSFSFSLSSVSCFSKMMSHDTKIYLLHSLMYNWKESWKNFSLKCVTFSLNCNHHISYSHSEFPYKHLSSLIKCNSLPFILFVAWIENALSEIEMFIQQMNKIWFLKYFMALLGKLCAINCGYE
jgi:hypothetical protein